MTFAEQLEPSQHFLRVAARRRRIASAQHRADQHIVFDGERGERSHQLKGAAYAAATDLIRLKSLDAFPAESDRTPIRREGAGNDVEQRGLARAVRADDGADRATRDLEADVIDRKQPAKALADPLNCKKRCHDRGPVTPSLPASQGHTPPGRAMTTTSRQSP